MEIIVDDKTIDLGEIDTNDDLFVDDIDLEDTLDLTDLLSDTSEVEVYLDE